MLSVLKINRQLKAGVGAAWTGVEDYAHPIRADGPSSIGVCSQGINI